MSVTQDRKIVLEALIPARRGGGGRTPGNSWWGCDAPCFKSWPYFRPKSVIFHARFQTSPLLYHYLDWNSKKLGICIFLCLSYIVWNWNNKYNMYVIHSRSRGGSRGRVQGMRAGGGAAGGGCRGRPPPPPPPPFPEMTCGFLIQLVFCKTVCKLKHFSN